MWSNVMPLWAQALLRLALGILSCRREEKARADHAAAVCALTLALAGCGASAARTSARPVPPTPGAIVTDTHICIPLAEAAELQLWIEEQEAR